MLQSGYINFFSANKCGLYRHFGEKPNGLDLAETFSKLKQWKDGRNFEATNPWNPAKNRNKTPCYCHAIHHDTENGDYFLVLWKGDSDRHGPLYGITVNQDGSIEQAVEQTKTKGKKQMIWGRPCYYWVIPELNIVASIKFDNSRTDSAMFQDWVSGCINLRVTMPEYKTSSTEKGFTRFEMLEDKDDKFRYSFQFDLSMKSLATSSAEMQDLAKRVTQVVRRETVSIKEVNKREGFASLFRKFTVPYISAEDESSRQVELRIEAKPTVSELEYIIETYASDHNTKVWEDVGFILDNTPTKIVWASTYRFTENISLDDDGQPVFKADNIYATIKSNRDRYLGPLRKDMASKQAAAHG